MALAEYVLCRRQLNIGSDEMATLLDGMSRVVNTPVSLDPIKDKLLADVCEALAQPLRRPPDTSDVVSGVDAAVVSAEAPGPPLSARMSMPRSIAGRSAVASPLSLPDRTSSSCTRGCPDDRSTLTVVWLLVAFAGSGVMVMTYLLMS